VVTFRKTVEFKYNCWEERGIPVVFLKVVVVRIKFKMEYEVDPASAEQIDGLRRRLLQEASQHDTEFSAYVDYSTPDSTMEVRGVLDTEELARVRRVFATAGGYFLWGFCTLLGFQPLVECFMRYTIGKQAVFCKKVISAFPGLRIGYLARDEAAAEVAIDRNQFGTTTMLHQNLVEEN
jgi:hypothetical protein